MKKNLFLLIIVLIHLSGCSTNHLSTRDNNDLKPNYEVPGFIIDAHVHYRTTDAWKKSFIDVYSARNAMACVMVQMSNLEQGIQFAKTHPDRVIPYAMIDIDSPTVLEDIKKAHAMGYKGLGEFFSLQQWNYDDLKYDPIWTLAEQLGMPIAPHLGAGGKLTQMRPGYLATIATNHPKLVIIGLHFGNPYYDEAGEVARRNENVYFDITGSSLLKKENDPGIWKEYLWWTPLVGKNMPHMPANLVPAFEKLVFGTDEGPEGMTENIRRFNKMLDANNVSKESRKKIYGLTMARIHGIKIGTTK